MAGRPVGRHSAPRVEKGSGMWDGKEQSLLLFVVGPTGIGKTTVVKHLVCPQLVWEAFDRAPARVPYIRSGAVVVLGRWAGFHKPVPGRKKVDGACYDGADRLQGERAGKALRDVAIPSLLKDGVKLMICDSTKQSSVFNMETMATAKKLNMKVMLVELGEKYAKLGHNG